MKQKIFFILFLCIPHIAFASDVHVTEVLFNPTGSDTGAEYIVLKNIGTETKDITGWQLYPDGIGYFTFPSFTLGAGATVKIFLRQSGDNTASILYYPTPSSNIGNTSGSIALFSSTQHDASTLVDFVQYGRSGETWETSADEAGLWVKGEIVATSADQEGAVLKRILENHNATAWQTVLVADSQDLVEQSEESDNNITSSEGGAGKVFSGPTFTPKIRAFAGVDRSSIAGAEIIFTGRALDSEDQPLESQLVRYVWNFGDGSFADGKNVPHTYSYPGTYIATLMIVQGEEIVQDECIIRVGGNTVHINEVSPGAQGWIELINTASSPVDITKWYLQDAQATQFTFPQGTRIAAGGLAVFANTTTNLANDISKVFPITLHYQNGKEADNFLYVLPVSSAFSLHRKDGSVVLGEKTPGTQNIVKQARVVIPTTEVPTTVNVSSSVAEGTSTLTHDTGGKDMVQASAINTDIPKPFYELRWLIVSIVAGLLVGGVAITFTRARRRSQ